MRFFKLSKTLSFMRAGDNNTIQKPSVNYEKIKAMLTRSYKEFVRLENLILRNLRKIEENAM